MERNIHHTQHKYKPLNECMYCGAKEGDLINFTKKTGVEKQPAKLSDEHIIPFGLGGTLLLPKSSCQECARITSDIERKVLKGFLYLPRVVGNLPTRKKKDRPDEIKLECIRDQDQPSLKNFTIDEAIALLILPTTLQPGCMTGINYNVGEAKVNGYDYIIIGSDTKEFLSKHNLNRVKMPEKIDVHSFLKMIAKIAYGYHVAMKGSFPRNESPLLPIILGKEKEIPLAIQDWIGSNHRPDISSSGTSLHIIYTDEYNDDHNRMKAESVTIQFFANSSRDGQHGSYTAFVRLAPI